MESKESEVTVAIIIASCNSAFEELQKNKNFSLSDSLAQECVNIAKGNINLSSAINLSKDKEGYITLLNFAAMILDKYIMIFKTQMPTFPQYKEIMKKYILEKPLEHYFHQAFELAIYSSEVLTSFRPSLFSGLVGVFERKRIENLIREIDVTEEKMKLAKKSLNQYNSENPMEDTRVLQKAGDGGGDCFIATVCYGSGYCDEVMELKKYRDKVLLNSGVGTFLVKTYYIVSPTISKYIKNKPKIIAFIRAYIINPIVRHL